MLYLFEVLRVHCVGEGSVYDYHISNMLHPLCVFASTCPVQHRVTCICFVHNHIYSLVLYDMCFNNATFYIHVYIKFFLRY